MPNDDDDDDDDDMKVLRHLRYAIQHQRPRK